MTPPLKPWAKGPFELLVHAEMHRRDGGDFDRRMAVISYDNAIETAITTYLSLNPIQRSDRSYERKKVETWLANYHSKLDFLTFECTDRGITIAYEKAEIVWYHDLRNEQYHGGRPTVPEWEHLEEVRKVALWVFSVLYDVPNVEEYLENSIAARLSSDIPQRSFEYDDLIDSAHGPCTIAGQVYPASEALYAVDPIAYSELGAELAQEPTEELASESGA